MIMFFLSRGIEHFGLKSRLAIAGLLTLTTWLFAETSYRFYESRFLALKSRFSK